MDKSKTLEAAARLVEKGAYDKALKEYQRLLEADPKDVRVLQKMGELYQKKGDNPQAAHCFTQVAERYAADGFLLKAVTLYKQVLEFNPNLLEVSLKIAESYERLDLPDEALAYLQLAATAYVKAGEIKKALDTLQRMVDLDPDNVAAREKLTELQARVGMKREAVPAPPAGISKERLFTLLTETDVFVKYGLHDKALEHLRRIFAVDPENLEAHEKAYQIHVASNNVAQAFEQLLNVLRLFARKAEVQRAQPYLDTLLQQNPDHPEVPDFLQALRPEDRKADTPPANGPPSLQQRLGKVWERIRGKR